MSIAYQTYTTNEVELDADVLILTEPPEIRSETSWSDPALIPSFVGFVFPIGAGGESSDAVGFCFAAPFRVEYGLSLLADDDVFNATLLQSFYRFRLAYAHDFRFSPAGQEGFLTHLSLGIAADLAIVRAEFKELGPDTLPGVALELRETEVGAGAGIGILLGLYDNTTTFKVNLGAAYQSKVNFDYSVSSVAVSMFDFPSQFQVGMTVYLFDGLPLRLTVDAQVIGWDSATPDSNVAGADDFEDVTNYSFGMEYRLKPPFLSDAVTFYPRFGVRRFDPPWESTERQELPGIGNRRLIIDSDDDSFVILSAGLGLGWSGEGGKLRAVDLSFDRGGDATGFAMGLTYEF
jgi:hypothetical protein